MSSGPRVGSIVGVVSLVCAGLLIALGPLAPLEVASGSTGSAGPGGGPSTIPSAQPGNSTTTVDPADPKIVPNVIPPRGSQIVPVSPPPAPNAASWTPLEEIGGGPVRFDRCKPVRYVVRRQSGPPNGFELLQEALQRTADASGYTFQFEGFTDQLPDEHFAASASAPPPVWIGWAFDDEGVALSKDPDHVGSGGPTFSPTTGESSTGFVVLRADVPLDHSFGPGRNTGNVLLHEVGHLLGLDHSPSDTDQMFDTLSDQSPDGFGPGDLSGLYEIGSESCF